MHWCIATWNAPRNGSTAGKNRKLCRTWLYGNRLYWTSQLYKKKCECWWKSRMYENFSAFSFLFFFLTEAVLTGTVWIDRTLANKPHMHAHACTAGLFLLRSFISCFLSSFSFKLLISHVFVSKPSLWWYFSTNFSLLCRLILLLSPPLAVFGILTDTCFYGEDE